MTLVGLSNKNIERLIRAMPFVCQLTASLESHELPVPKFIVENRNMLAYASAIQKIFDDYMWEDFGFPYQI